MSKSEKFITQDNYLRILKEASETRKHIQVTCSSNLHILLNMSSTMRILEANKIKFSIQGLNLIRFPSGGDVWFVSAEEFSGRMN